MTDCDLPMIDVEQTQVCSSRVNIAKMRVDNHDHKNDAMHTGYLYLYSRQNDLVDCVAQW